MQVSKSSMKLSSLASLQVPLEMVRAGLHWSRKMSKHMLPLELMFG